MTEQSQPKKKRTSVARPLLEWYQRHPGIIRRPDEIAIELGINPHSAMTAAATMCNDGVLEYGASRGNYVYRGFKANISAKPERAPIAVGTMLECVGITQNGDAVLRDENNIIHVARPIS